MSKASTTSYRGVRHRKDKNRNIEDKFEGKNIGNRFTLWRNKNKIEWSQAKQDTNRTRRTDKSFQ